MDDQTCACDPRKKRLWHCYDCHETFKTYSAFCRHRRRDWDYGPWQCCDPETQHLVRYTRRDGLSVWRCAKY